MRNRTRILPGMAMVLLVSACGGGSDAPAGNDAAGAATDTAVTGNMAATETASLAVYVGKHPSEKVDDMTFLEQPAVRAAVAATVPDAEVRDFVFNYTGPDTPIVEKDGHIVAWGCERHNCGYHNWTVAITPDGSRADVCYFEDDGDHPGPPEGSSTWYLAGGGTEQRPGNCPSE